MTERGREPETIETHISILVFLGEVVLKFRKPLRFDFLDLTSLEARELDCYREVELNRRLAPDVYLGVAEVTEGGRTLDHAVHMRRLPTARSLAELVRNAPRSVWVSELGRVAEVLGRFHAGAARSDEISLHATSHAVKDAFELDVDAIRPFLGDVIDARVHEGIVLAVRRYIDGRAPLFAERIDSGHVCDGHGDLQANDIYCLDDGPRILDCLEFDESLRCVDVVADIAFLAMDLERIGSPEAASVFEKSYERFAGEGLPQSLLDLYIALRAHVRLKIACIRFAQGDARSAAEAQRLLSIATSHLERAEVRAILVGGLPGTGKSTLASQLGAEIGAEVLRSDEVRRHLLGAEGVQIHGYREGRYTREMTRLVYSELLRRAEEHLSMGRSVVLDASWTDAVSRRSARALSEKCFAKLTELRCSAPPGVTERRIIERLQRGDDMSEATVEVARAMSVSEDDWPSAINVDTSTDSRDSLARALASISGPSSPA